MTTEATGAGAHGFSYQPALDGVRAVAVAMVLLFHHGWLQGGYLGVSVFFTLSGYLITSLALAEHDRTGRLDPRAFYARRLRRLLPASLACLAGIIVLAGAGLLDAVEHLRRDVWAALAQVYNWVALSGGQTYADLVAGGDGPPSPVEHYWSLAIEEQFYWVWPLVLIAVLRARRRQVVVVAALTIAAAAAAPLIAGIWGPDAAYWATPARLGEILVGALAAFVLHRRRGVELPGRAAWVAVAGLAVIVWAAVTWPSGTGPAYGGWLPLFAVASAALIVGLQVTSPVRRALGTAPLVAIGTISYGVYLYHWPVYVVLDAERTGLARPPLFVLRIAVTLALAAASFVLLERPIRAGRLRWRPGLPVALAGCASIALAIAVVRTNSTPYWMADPGEASAAALAPVDSVGELRAAEPSPMARSATTTATTRPPAATATSIAAVTTTAASTTTTPTTTTTTLPPAPAVPPLPTGLSRPVRIMIVGDSTAMATGEGLKAWAGEHADVARVAVTAAPGCGLVRDGVVPTDEDDGFRKTCRRVQNEAIPDALSALQPDVVVGMVTLRDIEDRVWDDAEGPIGPADDRFLVRLIADYDAATQSFLAAGATDVLWVVAPIPTVFYTGELAELLDPMRYERYAAALDEVVARYPGQAAVVDLAAWFAGQPSPPDRPDGLHWSPEAAKAIAADFLGPIVTAAALT